MHCYHLLGQTLVQLSGRVARLLIRLLVQFLTRLRREVSKPVFGRRHSRVGSGPERHALVVLVCHQVGEHIALLRLLRRHPTSCLVRRLDVRGERAAVGSLVTFGFERGVAFELGLGVKSFQQLFRFAVQVSNQLADVLYWLQLKMVLRAVDFLQRANLTQSLACRDRDILG